MCSRDALFEIVGKVANQMRILFGEALTDVILFGSYARQEEAKDSDIDIMILVNMPREQLIGYRRKAAEIANDILFDYGIVVSPLLESKVFFEGNCAHYPFFRNIDREGIRYAA